MKKQTFHFNLDTRPVRLAVDPQYDVLRLLHPSEVPASLAQMFSAKQVAIILPSRADVKMKEMYRKLAEEWVRKNANFTIYQDDQLEALPETGAVWLFGWKNRYKQQFSRGLASDEIELSDDMLVIDGKRYPQHEHSFAITALSGNPETRTIGWLAANSPASLPGLARKLPYYGKYSYVVFEGAQPKNTLKGRWLLRNSNMQVTLPGGESSPPMKLPGQIPFSAVIDR